jgi:hypothetical protein
VLQDTRQFSLATADLTRDLVKVTTGSTSTRNSTEVYRSLHESLLVWNGNLGELEERAVAISRALVIMGDEDFEFVGSAGHAVSFFELSLSVL